MSRENFLRRTLKPAGKKAGVGWVNFQVLRRSWATLAHDEAVTIKDVQAHLRHAHYATTADIYTQSIPASVREAVDGAEIRLIGEPQGGGVQ